LEGVGVKKRNNLRGAKALGLRGRSSSGSLQVVLAVCLRVDFGGGIVAVG
jgi:hypothetical protein